MISFIVSHVQLTPNDRGLATSRKDVFISYAAQDVTIAVAILAALEIAGVKCWIAPRDVISGQRHSQQIVDAINEAKVIVIVVSQSAIASRHIARDIGHAFSRGRTILAVRKDSTNLTGSLKRLLSHWDPIDVPALGMQEALARLSLRLKQALTTESHGYADKRRSLLRHEHWARVNWTRITRRTTRTWAAVSSRIRGFFLSYMSGALSVLRNSISRHK